MEVTLQNSKAKGKKYAAIITDGNKRKTVNFGAQGYEDFTIHKDEERRQRYLQRHKNDNINDIYSAGFWSWFLLWNRSTLEQSIKDIQNKKNIKIINKL